MGGLRLLKDLCLLKNPMETMSEYRSTVVFHLPTLVTLDNRPIGIKEKVRIHHSIHACTSYIVVLYLSWIYTYMYIYIYIYIT